MTILDLIQSSQYARILARREHELCAVLNSVESAVPTASADHDVVDFKDVAAEQSAASIGDCLAEQAAHELEQVLAARRRLHDGSYGLCVDCGDEIHPLRLAAMPATPYCTACQTVHEYPQPIARR